MHGYIIHAFKDANSDLFYYNQHHTFIVPVDMNMIYIHTYIHVLLYKVYIQLLVVWFARHPFAKASSCAEYGSLFDCPSSKTFTHYLNS